MDGALYDEFGNYIGPELASDDSEDEAGASPGQVRGRRRVFGVPRRVRPGRSPGVWRGAGCVAQRMDEDDDDADRRQPEGAADRQLMTMRSAADTPAGSAIVLHEARAFVFFFGHLPSLRKVGPG